VNRSQTRLSPGPLRAWFKEEWLKHTDENLDLGKCCLRLRRLDEMPYGLIGELAGRMTPSDWVGAYRAARQSDR
jgi:hypothetical protein